MCWSVYFENRVIPTPLDLSFFPFQKKYAPFTTTLESPTAKNIREGFWKVGTLGDIWLFAWRRFRKEGLSSEIKIHQASTWRTPDFVVLEEQLWVIRACEHGGKMWSFYRDSLIEPSKASKASIEATERPLGSPLRCRQVVIVTEKSLCGVSWDAYSMLDLLVTAIHQTSYTLLNILSDRDVERDTRIDVFSIHIVRFIAPGEVHV
jgi:hypothetical protein